MDYTPVATYTVVRAHEADYPVVKVVCPSCGIDNRFAIGYIQFKYIDSIIKTCINLECKKSYKIMK
jgi:RNase P subunit RPR2